jgi:hypothetical protein
LKESLQTSKKAYRAQLVSHQLKGSLGRLNSSR